MRESAISTMMVCGILSEPFCGVCADACRPSWCHSALCLHTRKTSVTQLSRQPSQFPLHHVCLREYHYIPEELTVAMDEMLDELMGEVMYEVLDEVIEEVIDENPKPMTCEEFLEVLRPHFDFLFLNYQVAIFHENGRCHSRYFRMNICMRFSSCIMIGGFMTAANLWMKCWV